MTVSVTISAKTPSPRRHPGLRLLGMLAAVLLAFLGPGAAAASGTVRPTTLAGEWDVRVSIYTQDPPLVERAKFTFLADQKLDTLTLPQQGDPLPGEGIWQLEGRYTLAFWITHPHPDENGNTIGTTNAIHLGSIYGDRFTTKATGYIAMNDGSWFGPVPVRTEGVRVR